MIKNRKGIFFCLVGPAGGGKTTFANRLLEDFKGTLSRSVSCTSRVPRHDELPGDSYHFVSRTEFQSKIDNKQFYEWEEIHGNFYGTLKSTIDDVLLNGNDLLLVIDIKGAVNFKKNFPEDCVICFVLPPKFSLLKKRLQDRGNIDNEELEKRLATARNEYLFVQQSFAKGNYKEIDYIVVNDDLSTSYQEVVHILKTEKLKLSRINKVYFNEITSF